MSQKLLDIVNTMYAALPAKDFATFEANSTPDFLVVEADSLPFAGAYVGMSGFAELVGKVFSLFSTFEPTLTDMAVSDSRVMVWVDMKLTGAESGKTVTMPMIEVFTFEGDKVKEIRPFYFEPDAIKSIL